MKTLNEVDLKEPAQHLALANTPFYLIRKLRSDPTVIEIGQQFSDDEILGGLKTALNSHPTDAVSAVRPYVYLAALSKKLKSDALRAAASIQTEQWPWYSLVASSLLEMDSPIILQSFSSARSDVAPPKVASSVPAGRIILEP